MSEIKQGAPKGNTRQHKATRTQTPKPRTPRRVMQTLAPRDALQLLESAVSYCQQAGLQVYAANALEGLRFYLPHAELIETANGGAAFRLLERAAIELTETAPMLPTADAAS